jgi:hypothetical protein
MKEKGRADMLSHKGLKSTFIPFYLEYKIGDEGAAQQARAILAEISKCRELGYKKVGIIYSANAQQSKRIRETYALGQWHTHTSGANQADVMRVIEALLNTDEFKALQNVFRILPITTCAWAGGGGRVDNNLLTTDLIAITDFIAEEGHVVLGWQNQDSVRREAGPYAIGGGISQQLTPEQDEEIQALLVQLSQEYQARENLSAMNSTDTLSALKENMRPYYEGLLPSSGHSLGGTKEIWRRFKASFKKFINPKIIPVQQNIFFTIGHGGEKSQLWNNLYYDAQRRGETVLNVIVEPSNPYYERAYGQVDPEGYKEILPSYEDLTIQQAMLRRTAIKPFFVAFPFSFSPIRPEHEYVYAPHAAWDSRPEFNDFYKQWEFYLTECLKRGKNIFLGYYIDGVPKGDFLRIYNQLKAKYAKQLFLVLGHEQYAAVVTGKVSEKQLTAARIDQNARRQEPIKSLFKFFNEKEGGLMSRGITLNNLRRWSAANQKGYLARLNDYSSKHPYLFTIFTFGLGLFWLIAKSIYQYCTSESSPKGSKKASASKGTSGDTYKIAGDLKISLKQSASNPAPGLAAQKPAKVVDDKPTRSGAKDMSPVLGNRM